MVIVGCFPEWQSKRLDEVACLTHLSQMDLSTLMSRMSPLLPNLEVLGDICPFSNF